MGTGTGEAQGASRIIYPDIPDPDIPEPLTPADLHRLFISSYAERQWGLRHFLLPKVTVGFAGDSSTSRPSAQATAQRLLQINRGHWVIESSCQHHRLELRRGSQPHPQRLWPGKYLPLAPLRRRPHQI